MQKSLERLDKAISSQTSLSRRDVHKLMSRGKVLLNGKPVKVFDTAGDPDNDEISVDGKVLDLTRLSYLMMNKPRGVVCATHDDKLKTVIDLVPEQMKRKGLFPAGRLDKDTEGFVLLTNDGDFAHRILSPRSHVPKTYIARLDKEFNATVKEAFESGVVLSPERAGEVRTICLPAEIEAVDGDFTHAMVTIRQGVYHQIKRMFSAFGLTVLELRREKIGGLLLDPAMPMGGCRKISDDEKMLITK